MTGDGHRYVDRIDLDNSRTVNGSVLYHRHFIVDGVGARVGEGRIVRQRIAAFLCAVFHLGAVGSGNSNTVTRAVVVALISFNRNIRNIGVS